MAPSDTVTLAIGLSVGARLSASAETVNWNACSAVLPALSTARRLTLWGEPAAVGDGQETTPVEASIDIPIGPLAN